LKVGRKECDLAVLLVVVKVVAKVVQWAASRAAWKGVPKAVPKVARMADCSAASRALMMVGHLADSKDERLAVT